MSCSYSGFPVLNTQLCELQDGPRIPKATSALKHISPISPAAIFRRSQQVEISNSSLIQITPHDPACQISPPPI